MANKILLAVNNSKNSVKAVKYASNIVRPESMLTIFSVLPDPTSAYGMNSPSLSPLFKKNIQAFRAIEDAYKTDMKEFMEMAKKTLVKGGIPAKNISVKIRKKNVGIVKGILKEAEQGNYNTIVIGRRPHSVYNQFNFASVSNKVVQLARNVAVVVVD